jgi:hypothetical protein
MSTLLDQSPEHLVHGDVGVGAGQSRAHTQVTRPQPKEEDGGGGLTRPGRPVVEKEGGKVEQNEYLEEKEEENKEGGG